MIFTDITGGKAAARKRDMDAVKDMEAAGVKIEDEDRIIEKYK